MNETSNEVHHEKIRPVEVVDSRKIISCGVFDDLIICTSTNLDVLFSLLASDFFRNPCITSFILHHN